MRHWLALAKQNAERDGALTAEQTEQVRTRVRLLIDITARAGAYRKGLLAAAGQLSPEEAAIIVDLARHGMQVPQLHDVLCGGHVLVDVAFEQRARRVLDARATGTIPGEP